MLAQPPFRLAFGVGLAIAVALACLPVRANAVPGALAWQEQLDVGGTTDETRALAPSGNWFIAAGDGSVAGVATWLVRAYDAKRGTLLWDDRLNVNGGDARAKAVAVRGRRTIVAGEVTAAGETNWLVRAYDTKTGATLWYGRPKQSQSDSRFDRRRTSTSPTP